ncbi:MAG: HDOD domain-containing protein [Chloroflexi bacterium]|nr:HDOD domain-containing protein [Chloroflexota bacterium]
MNYSVDELILEATRLPPIPQAAQKALAFIRDPASNAADLAAVLSKDQVLSAHVLRWANSALYGMENRIATVQQAIVVLGLTTVQELILAHSMADRLNKAMPGYELNRGDLWHHAVGTAIGAKLISKERSLKIDEEAYFAGLLCDMGKLVFEKLLRDTDTSQPEWSHHPFQEMELATFGIDHAMLGAEMARRWQLPEHIVTAIAHHHNPEAAPNNQILVSAVHVADSAMMMLGVGIGIDGLQYTLDLEALKRLRMNEQDLILLVEQVSDQLAHAKELIYFG